MLFRDTQSPESNARSEPALPSCEAHETADFQKFTYNIDLEYNITPDKRVYFAHRLGYRAGGFGIRAKFATQRAPFKPESVNDYELGAELEWRFGGVFLRTDMAAYTRDFVNIQRLVPFEASGVTQTNIQNTRLAPQPSVHRRCPAHADASR